MIINKMTLTETKTRLSMPAVLLRIEGLVLFAAAIAIYFTQSFGWVRFVALLLAPDLVFIIYMINKRAGTVAYNAVHALILPVGLGVIAVLIGWSLGVQFALIWLAHIGMDRMIGYGLKYMSGFKDTHLGRA